MLFLKAYFMIVLLLKKLNIFISLQAKWSLFALFFVLFNVFNSTAQVSGYSLNQLATTATFPLTGKTALSPTAGLNIDDAVYTLAMPIPFAFNGVNYPATTSNIFVSINGFVTFGSTPTVNNYNPISSTAGYNGAISLYGRDMDLVPPTTAKNIGYVVSGTAPNRILKIEWVVQRSNGTSSSVDTGNMVFQLWLYETTNVVEMHYNTFNPSSLIFTGTGQIGLRGSANTDFKNLDYSTLANWPALPSVMNLGTVNTASVVTKNATAQIAAGSNRLFRWTPQSCFAPSGVTFSAITSSSATVSWNASSPAPTLGYDYYVSTTAVPPTAVTPPTGSVAAGITTVNLSGLTGATTYYVYVRSKCAAADTSAWSNIKSFTTLCNAVNDPYYNYFGEYDPPYEYFVPAMLPCHSIQNVGVGPLNNWQTSQPTTQSSTGGFIDEHLVYDATTGTGGTDAANVWFFTPGFNLIGGTAYKLNYMYGGSTETPTITNKMLVKYGTSPTDAAMTSGWLLVDHDNIKASPLTSYVSFTPSTSGVYYIGFKAYSQPGNGRLFLDNIELTKPGCVNPTAVVVSNVTSSSATVSWTAPSPAPVGGYAYYVTTTSTPPSFTQTPTGLVGPGTTVVNLTGLTGSTTYYVWIRSKCNPTESDFSVWSTVQTFTTLFQPLYCVPSNAATTSYFNNFVTTGGIANISNATGFSTGGYGVFTSQIVSQSAGNTINFNCGLTGVTVGVALWVDWNNDGTFSTAERMYNTAGYVSAASGTFAVPGGQPLGDYRMRIVMDFLSTNPSSCTFSGAGEAEDYTFRVVTPPPPLALNSYSSTQCASTNSPLIQITAATLGNFNTYSWSPSIGVTGNSVTGYTINSNSSINYTLTGTQTVAPYATRSVTYSYIANPLPTPITISPGSISICTDSTPTSISASGGNVSGLAILSENFNSGATGWSTTSLSSGGNTAAAAWTIRSSGYNPAGSSGISSVVSNDSSSFYVSNSDAQGSGSNTFVTLTSPTFSLSGYTNVDFSFYHYYKPWINGSAVVEIYSGTTWTTLMSWGASSNTPAQGTPTNFAYVNYSLNAYAGQSGLKIRFTYQASWGYIWAIDNFLISGSASSPISWNTQTSPVANGVAVPGLFTNAAGTTPYLAGTGATSLYVSTNSAVTYAATASTPSPVCSSVQQIVVNVLAVPGTASSNQTICSGAPANITLTGSVGTIIKWQYSNTLAFTSPVDIPSSNSATLTSAQMGVLAATRYYRAVISNGTCTVYSNIITIGVSASTTWNGSTWSNGLPDSSKAAIFNADFDSTGDIEACSVTILSGETAFYAGHSLIVQNFVNASGGVLRFENSASLVQVNNSAINAGNIIYKRNTTPVKKFDYTYWSSPVASQTLFNLSPLTLSDKYFAFDPVVGNWANTSPNTIMAEGKGYIVRSPNNFDPVTPAIFNAQFNGVPNNGVITTPIVGASAYNLIGNPYPSAINIDTFFDFNGSGTGTGVIEKTIYLWTHNTPISNNVYSNNDYATYNYMGGVGTAPAINSGVNNTLPLGKVAAGQSFFIKGLAAGNATFNNAMRVVGNNNQFFKNVEPASVTDSKNRVWLEMFNNQGAFKQTLIGYTNSATANYDDGYDGELFDGGTSILFYSLLAPKKLAIQGKGLPFNEQDIVPLGYQVNTAGTYEIKLSNFDGIFNSQQVYLEDKLLNVIHALKESNYVFTTNEGTNDTRFLLRYTDGAALNNASNLFTENSVVVYKNNQDIHINTGLITIDEVTIYDIRGSVLYTKKGINSADFTISNLASSQQMILIQLKSLDGSMVTKKLIF